MDKIVQKTSIHVSGKGFAEFKIPFAIRTMQFLAAFFSSLAAGLLCFRLSGWNWLSVGFNTKVAIVSALSATAAAAIFLFILRSNLIRKLWNIRQIEKKWVYGGYAGFTGPTVGTALVVLPLLISVFIADQIRDSFPIPLELRTETPAESATASNLKPVFLWDYGTVYNPAWFADLEIVLPYEKGPPEKLLGSLYLQHRKTRALVASFYGKRPRFYERRNIEALFSAPASAYHPRHWPLLYNLAKESGTLNKPSLTMFRNTHALSIGNNSHMFFLGPDGSVFQVRCDEPCSVRPMLEQLRFSEDARATLGSRKELTKKKLNHLLNNYPRTAEGRLLHESELILTLVSWLSLDPRDPEAFFHIGKLATNRETIASAIRYGKDLNMSSPQLAELQSRLAQFDY